MQNNVIRKGLVFGIIVLFVGASVVPTIGETIVENNELQSKVSTIENTYFGDSPVVQWIKTFGGLDESDGRCVRQCNDGGYIITGSTYDNSLGDFWIIKTDSNGKRQWDKKFSGSSGTCYGFSVQQTFDGGYIAVGTYGFEDVWLIKIQKNGVTQWSKKFHRSHWDIGNSVQQTVDGGFIITGITGYDGYGGGDVWLIKTNSGGTIQWEKTFGGPSMDEGHSVQQTADGGYIISAWRSDNDNFWLIKTDVNGNMQWNRMLGPGPNQESSVRQTRDFGYIVTTTSYGDTGSRDVLLIKTDPNGYVQWSKYFGGAERDEGKEGQQTGDGGYIISGYTESYGGGPSDLWLIKTDANGNKGWDKTIGGSDWDGGHSVQQTRDGGYIITGETCSYGLGPSDLWLIKVASERWWWDYEDQSQKTYSNVGYPIFHCEWQAQSFRPSFNVLTRVKLFLYKSGYPPNNLIVSIRDNIYGVDLASITIDRDMIPTSQGWVTADFPDLYVNTNKDYYILLHTLGGGFPHEYVWLIDENDPYPPGKLIKSNDCGSSWYWGSDDFGFITYGYPSWSFNGNLFITGYCPIDMVVTDPDGRTINKTHSDIPNATYVEEELNGIGTLDDQIWIPYPLDGEFSIQVVPASDANLSDNYSIVVNYEGGQYNLVENVTISDIPQDPYVFKTTRPTKPSKPIGELSGRPGEEYFYTTSSTDPDGGELFYLWDWGDDNTSELGPYNSGEVCEASHVWNEKGNYSIRVRAKNSFTVASEWSDLLTVSITTPRNRPFNLNLLNWLFERFPLLEVFLRAINLLR